ncbi:DUF1684 domain-containing protein [Tunicatimonas pelagia]|uniref:DUF1684 domain-containing protein n=1 Tax=Tunicatimonas pelagia TaxID=931531 RepID=UPI00266682CE|nr:DUF1684 domain-containing protein [Tunicatimonas pelagia]WKN44795.1 DUF1684 domain-containing protein [Tunicatimonas pelagia]
MNKVVLAVVGLVSVAILVYALQGGESEEDYTERILKERENIRNFLRGSDESPFAPDSVQFKELSYYEPNPAYQVAARLKRVEDHKLLTLPTSDGKDEKYIRYGYADFEIEERPQRLLVLQPFEQQQPPMLFVAFADATSGEETYGGGRYLNVEMPSRTGQKTLSLDFNLAYNPYCAYNPTFSCPLPPRENVLDIPIPVGEKNFDE